MDLKRIYTDNNKTPARKALEQEALLKLRTLRVKLKQEHPGVLEKIQHGYETAQNPNSEIPIDRQKNVQTVAAFLALRGISLADLKGITRH